MAYNKKSSKPRPSNKPSSNKLLLVMLRVFAVQSQIVLLGVGAWYVSKVADEEYPLRVLSQDLPWGIIVFPLWMVISLYLTFRATK